MSAPATLTPAWVASVNVARTDARSDLLTLATRLAVAGETDTAREVEALALSIDQAAADALHRLDRALAR